MPTVTLKPLLVCIDHSQVHPKIIQIEFYSKLPVGGEQFSIFEACVSMLVSTHSYSG